MNKNKFRVVFNKARGLMMVVAENAGSHSSKSRQAVSTSTCPDNKIQPRLLLLPILVVSGLIMMSRVVSADIIADPSAPANQRPIIFETANGLPLVNIQTPSAAGVSRNSYQQFDVKSQGAILNNSNNNTQTQLGGWVQGNPNLAAGTAKVILNEVNSHHPSYLNGYIEVAGSRAQVVIANPAGISCSGCGFINANRATLTTGTPIINSGSLIGYRVGGGSINFLGSGLDTSQSNFTDVIAQAVNVNAGIWANSLNITTGLNQVNVDKLGNQTHVSPIDAAPDSAPAFAVDVAALGGMYAGKIHMIGTEAGLGVRNAGDIGASAGDVIITADGMLQNAGTISATSDIQLDVIAMESDGSIRADTDISINLVADYLHTGELQAGRHLDLQTSGDITNQSTILASQSLQLAANNIDNTHNGEIAGHHTHISVADTLVNRGLMDGVQTQIHAETLINHETGSIFADQLAIQVAQLVNDAGAVIAARDGLDIGAETIENLEDSLIFSAGDLAIAGRLDNGGQAVGSADLLINEGSTIEALGDLKLSVAELQNLNANLVTELVQIGSASFNLFTPRDTSVILNAADYPGARIGDESISWRTAGNYTFREYHRYLGTTVTRETRVIDSAPGQIFSGGDMTIEGAILNSDSQIIAGGALDVTGASLQNLNTQGEIRARSSGHVYYYDYDGSGSGFKYRIKHLGPYNPADVVTTFNLSTTEFAQHTSVTGSGTSVEAATVPVATNSLFQPSPDIAAAYLIETNPRFANYRSWLSSDYMMQQLAFDPATTQKRLGDGFYEQRLVREQVAQLTGRRFLDGHASDEAQYQALMTSALTQVEALQLIPGVALSAEQVAQLTSDIVWLVEQTVTLADGTTTQALVPQVYIRPQSEDLQPSTGMMAGNTVTMNVTDDLVNEGTIAGRTLMALSAENINNLGGQMVAETTVLQADNDINIIGGQVSAADVMWLEAGNDITLQTTTQSSSQRVGANRFSRTNIDRVAGLYVSNPDAVLIATAGNDVNLMAASIVNQGEAASTQINAGENITLGTVQVAQQNSSVRNARNYVSHGGIQDVGTFINSTGDIAFNAGNDFTATAATINSNAGAISITATQAINIQEGRETSNFDSARRVRRSSTFSSKTTTERNIFESDSSISSTLSGDTVTLQSGNELNIRGSNVISDSGTTLTAGGDVNITAASNSAYEYHERKTRRSGLSATSTSISLGSSQLSTKQTSDSTYLTGSTVGSVEGDVTIQSGSTYTQQASDVIAPQGNIDISAQQVNIIAGQNTRDSSQETKFKQSGFTLSAQSKVLNIAQNVVDTAQATLESEGSRNKSLNALQTYANRAKLIEESQGTVDAIKAGNIKDTVTSAGVRVSVSVGSSKSESSSLSSLTNNQGSLVKAGGDITITATQDDLTVVGSQISADKNLSLDAARNMNLIASADRETNQSKNKSSSTSMGVSIGVGGEGTGLSFDLAASRGKGNANSDSLIYNNTQVSAGEVLALNSGKDTNLIGANASGKQVIVDVAGDLNIESVQDTATSKANQNNTGISASMPIGAEIPSVSISNSKQK
ncbi:Large exoprotein, partial [Methylophaga lonarensis MPL]